ncbi:hypothetical protein [Herbaspirillum aquaticum]|nr:hypothetical protein [Herbaspirillum aquaticum]
MLSAELPWVRKTRKKALEKPAVWRTIAVNGAFTLIAVAGLPVAVTMTAIAVGVPGLLANAYANAQYKHDIEQFRKGCWPQVPSLEYQCSEVRRDGKPSIRGFIIASSPTHLAIFDDSMKKARAIEREKTEIIGNPDQPNEGKLERAGDAAKKNRK